jgi:hypothetical protein
LEMFFEVITDHGHLIGRKTAIDIG